MDRSSFVRPVLAVAVAAGGLLFTTGCIRTDLPFDYYGVLMFEFPLGTLEEVCTSSYTENLLLADPPAVLETVPDPTRWNNTFVGEYAPQVVFGLLYEAADGYCVLDIAGDTFIGMREGNRLSLSLPDYSNQTWDSTVPAAGYAFSFTNNWSETATLDIDLPKLEKENAEYKPVDKDEAVAWEGTVGIEYSSLRTWRESDLWDLATQFAAIGFPTYPEGDITDAAFSNLSLNGFVGNTADSAECLGDPCEITVSESCSGSYTFTVRETTLDPDAYLAVALGSY